MKPGRINKRERMAEQRRAKRAMTAGVWLTAAKVPPRPIVVEARKDRPLPAAHYPAKRAQLGKPQTAEGR
jgi:hypothetical protein